MLERSRGSFSPSPVDNFLLSPCITLRRTHGRLWSSVSFQDRLLDDLRNDEDSVRRARFQKDVDEEGGKEEEEDEDDDEDADDDDNENDLAEWEAIIYHAAQTNYENEV